jgi:cysteine-S-conjugate beta-lyase
MTEPLHAITPDADDEVTSTSLIHHRYQPPATWEALPVGVHKASSVFFPNVAAMHNRRWDDKSGYTYGLHGTPTSFTLEARLATLEGARHVILTPSGLSAIALVNQAVLKAGDELVLPDNVYGPSRSLARHELRRWGIEHRVYDPMDLASFAESLNAETRLVWLEAPGSVTLEFPDLIALIRCARERAPQAVIALDNTWGAGLAFDAFELAPGLGVDLTIHALTKYPSGGADVLMGSVACRDDRLYQTLTWCHSRQGLGVGMNDVEAVLRGLPSMPLRYAAQDAAARQVAQWCQGQRAFARVLHPALPDSPGHAHWASLCRSAAGLVTVEIDPRYTTAQAEAFVDALRLFRIAYSWGGPVSLVVPYDAAQLRSLPTPYRGTLVRLCIGLERVEDLLADLEQAIAQALPA